jgi:ATP-dependent protease ClpP protease subunit
MWERVAYFKNHWLGLHSIPRVVWINLFALSLIVSVLLDLVPEPLNSFQLTTGILILSAIFIWQLIGAIRTLQNARRDQTDVTLIAMLSIAIVVVSAISIWRSYEFIFPSQKEVVTAEAEAIQPLPISDDGSTIFLSGDINYPIYRSFLRTLDENKGAKTVTLSSPGGIIFAARAIANKITERKLNTKVEENCFSACTLIFLSGGTRQLEENGKLGFHLYATETMLTASILDIEEQVEKDKEYLRSRGVAEDFILEAYSTPPTEIWVPDYDRLTKSGILVK